MTRDELKSIIPNIGKEELDRIMAINGADIEKAKGGSESLSQQITDLTAQIAERDKQLGELKKAVKDNEGLTAQITKLEDENKSSKAEYEAKIGRMKRDFAVTSGLREAKAKNAKAVLALLDLEKVTLDGEKLVGFTEQVEALKKSEDTAFLFDVEDGGGKGGVRGYKPAGNGGQQNDKTGSMSFTDAIAKSIGKI